jgi:membrane protein
MFLAGWDLRICWEPIRLIWVCLLLAHLNDRGVGGWFRLVSVQQIQRTCLFLSRPKAFYRHVQLYGKRNAENFLPPISHECLYEQKRVSGIRLARPACVMNKLWKLGGLSWVELGKRVWLEINGDDIWGRSAQLAYYFLLALFPLLIFLTAALGLMLGAGAGLRVALFNYLSQVMPGTAFQLVDTTMEEITGASNAGKLSFGLLATLWAASNGMGAITQALNAAYDLNESRPWWKQRLVAISLTIALSVLVITALVLILVGGQIADWLAAHFGLGSVFSIAWKTLQWPIVFGFMVTSFALIYYYAPDFKDQEWKWLTPGSAIGVVLWLLVSFGFKAYLHYFDSYSKTYGSLGAVIVLMLWLFFTGAALLIGSEINSEIENAAAEAGAPDAKERGEKSPSGSHQEAA